MDLLDYVVFALSLRVVTPTFFKERFYFSNSKLHLGKYNITSSFVLPIPYRKLSKSITRCFTPLLYNI